MDGNLSAVAKTAKQLALLAETLERRSAAAVSTQERSALDLHNAVSTARANIDQFLQSAHREIENSTRTSFDRILTERSADLNREVDIRTSQIRAATEAVDVTATVARSSMVKHLRMTYVSIAGATALLALGGGGLIWAEFATYKDATARAAAAKIQAEVYEAYLRVGLTSCGGKPCVRLDKKAPRWGNHGEYVLVDMKGSGR
jgi:hypothetical protein